MLHLGRFSQVLAPEIKQTVEDVEKQFQAGELVFEDCQVEGAESWCLKESTPA
ncbi:MAG: hypothetical protein HC881_10335 [Leptolyngbyaceae cyanobacterium SL_7_1]|nr:hypothetical protein [Leptolyngbyaceae cyanobacterium SL_7_1]